MRQLRIIVVDDHQLMVEAVRAALADAEDIVIVGEAQTGDDALALARRECPDLAIVDLRMPGISGAECIAGLRREHPQIRVVALSGLDDPGAVRQALDAGASAYVSKLIDPRDIAATLRQVVEGTVVSPGPSASANGHAPDRGLTSRELEVLRHVAAGASNKEIGRILHLSEQTVKYHLSRAYSKLGVAGRVDAIRLALEEQLIELESAPSR